MFFKKILFPLLLLCIIKLNAQTTFYNLNTLQKIEIKFLQANWDYQMDTAKYGKGGDIMALWVKINGIQYDSVGVRYKGSSSYDSTYNKNPLHITLNAFKNQNHQGFADVKLGNSYADPSMIREVLSYSILKNYMDCPRANFAQLYINATYRGVYANDEAVNKQFCYDHFYSSSGNFFKCNPVVVPGPSTKSNLKNIPLAIDSSGYYNYYELKSNVGWNNLVAFTNTVTNVTANIETAMDMDRAIWMLAFDNVLVNLDSYMGVFAQNYYLYKDNNARYNPIVWDLNMSFGGFPFVGFSNTSMGSLPIANLQTLTANIHSADQYWPLINAVQNNPMFKRMYIAHMRTILNEMFVSNSYTTMAAQMQSVIDTAVQSDPFKFYTYPQFQNGMNTNVSVGSYSVPGISTLMASRIAYLQSTPDFTYTTPAISLITASSLTPAINSTVTITAKVLNTNTNAVYLGYRYFNSDRFTRVLMYDDGLHNDGPAGDNVYGAPFVFSSGQAQYYIYAENNNAGMFSPQRAEHEFYTLVGIPVAGPGQVKINEFIANNLNGVKNEYLLNADWIEFYNSTNSMLDMTGLYLTNDFAYHGKFCFPKNSFIPAYSYLIVWADKAVSTATFVHCNFKLTQAGDRVMLSNPAGAILDSARFGAQITDVSTGRCPDGVGTFTTFVIPTFKLTNCPVGINELTNINSSLVVYPNPSSNYFYVKTSDNNNSVIEITNSFGQLIYRFKETGLIKINCVGWASGIYFLRCDNFTSKIIISN